jgi:hypothetical protein
LGGAWKCGKFNAPTENRKEKLFKPHFIKLDMAEKKNRPDKVSTAITLLWITIAIGIVSSTINFSASLKVAEASGLGLAWLIFTLYFTFLFLAFFIYKIGQGRNWARITFLVLFIIGVPMTIYSYLTTPIDIFSLLLGLASTIMQLVALVFLFQKSSSDWFKSKKK